MTALPEIYAKDTPGEISREILIVDDSAASLKQIGTYLAGTYDFSMAKSGEQALRICERERPDLILLDIDMPDMDGFEVIRRLKVHPLLERIPVIFLTGSMDTETEARGLRTGARDFIKKPVEKDILLHRLSLHLRISSYEGYLAESVMRMTEGFALSIANLIECRDENTGGHVQRTSRYVEILGRHLFSKDLFLDELSGSALDMMVRAAPLHDVGKISISDRILLKPGRLSDEEFAVMKTHSPVGAQMLKDMYERTPAQTYLRYARMIAAAHHERFDGKGYPSGLAEEGIPLCARIMAVADVYDALVDDRVYRRGMTHDEAAGIVMEGRGTQFDPKIVDSFDKCRAEFAALTKDRCRPS
ncbi:MAG: response regulator [Synergistaceae bacterium]|jgi:putative two-component system response regulator|nr:response regulator [Synergistaceae bacterium]